MIVAIQSYVSKRTPKMIRGMINAVIGCMGCIGSIIYLQIAGWALKWHVFMIFGVIVIIDALMLVFLLIMIKIGKFGQPAYDMGGGSDDEGKSVRGEEDGEGGYADIPQLPDVHEERLLEANEEHEESTVRDETFRESTIKDDLDLLVRSKRSNVLEGKVGSI